MKRLIFPVFLLFLSGSLLGQKQLIKGQVLLEGDPVIGATIVEKDITPINGTITDFNGEFEIQVSTTDAVLTISYIGLENQDIALGGRTQLKIEMQQESEFLDEIVVVGYGNQKKSKISGAVSTVTSDEIKKLPALRVEQAIQGRTAGIQISQNSGSPGSALTVRIRGLGSVNNSDPLFVVDGVIVEGMDFLNPSDIENISVLKDAASAAVYGARAANGVVLITTKSGKKNTAGQISLETYRGVQSVTKQLDLLNAREYAVILNESYINAGRAPFANTSDVSIFNEGTDWQRAIFSTAPISSYQLNMSGGGEHHTIGMSASYFSQDGIVGGEKARFDRATARINMGYDIKPWLNVGGNVAYTLLHRRALPENNEFTSPVVQALNMDPLTPITKPDGTYAYSDFVDTDIRNPVNAIENTNDIWTSNRIIASLAGTITFTEDLKFKSTFSQDVTFAHQKGFSPKFNLSVDTIDAPTAEKSLTNTVSINNNTWQNWQWENLFLYDKQFGDHKLGIVAGISSALNTHRYNGGANTNLPSNDAENAFISNTIDPIASQSVYEGLDEYSFFSYISKVNYDYKNKYLATMSFRADGSSKFGANKRFGYFPSISLGWVASREDFWKSETIDLFKVRASWGQNGNDRIGNYGFTSVVFSGQNYTFGPDQNISNGSIALTVSNPDLQWETVTQTNLGIDMEMLNGKIAITSDYYIKNTSDMLYNAPIPGIVGAAAPVRNIGEIKNTGLEFSLQYSESEKAFNYDIGANISFLSNEVVFLGGGDPQFTGQTFVSGAVAKTDIGHPIASFFGFETDGIFQTQEEVEAHAFQNAGTAPGDIRFKDLNKDGIIDNDDKTYIGNPTPDFIYGFTANTSFKNFDLSLFFSGVYGNELFNASVRYDKIGGNKPASILERWTGPGTSNTLPKVSLDDPNQNVRVSDRFIEDGSYLRLKNIQLGYAFPKFILNKIKLSKLRIYLSAQNLITWTKYSGYDPEIGSNGTLDIGIDRGFYPASKIILGGIQIGF